RTFATNIHQAAIHTDPFAHGRVVARLYLFSYQSTPSSPPNPDAPMCVCASATRTDPKSPARDMIVSGVTNKRIL
ncbi:MAG: hypothetical protein ACYDBJ_07805, partial [Aggregatilineales bacterium]